MMEQIIARARLSLNKKFIDFRIMDKKKQ